jgi:hypothetical protein
MEAVLYSFQSETDGWGPSGAIWLNGRVYGTTNAGGAYKNGTVFELVHTKSGWVKDALYEFTGQLGVGNPGAPVADRHGNLYGAAGGVFPCECGIIFELSPDSRGRWRFQVVHVFDGKDGDGPEWLTVDEAGNLYGTTGAGGGSGCAYGLGCGTVYELSPERRGEWKMSILHRFDGGDGAYPLSPLYRDARGDLYGTTQGGGAGGCLGQGTEGCGTVFELSPSGKGWKFTVIRRFTGPDGDGPMGRLAMDKEGNLYGTTGLTLGRGYGVVYRLTPGKKGWRETALHFFTGQPDGDGPVGGVILDTNGDLYGTTVAGGQFNSGAVFQLHRADGGWKESVAFSFNGQDGYDPNSPLSQGAGDALVGATAGGGNGACTDGCGVVFEVVP